MILKKIFSVFKPEPYPSEIIDAVHVKQKYKYWRIRTFYSIYVGYVFFYFTRKNLTFITPFLTTDLGITKASVGYLISILAITYGISKFTSGILADRSNPRYLMSFGLILTGILNILFSCSSSLLWFSILWGLNGFVQGWGWPACTKQLTYWFSSSERGTWWSVCTTSNTVGGFSIALLAAWCGQSHGWRFGMFVPGLLCVIVGCWLLNRLRDIPQSLGLPSIEIFKEEYDVTKTPNDLRSSGYILFKYVIKNRYVWILAFSYFFVYLVKESISNWYNLYLMEMKGYTSVHAATCIGLFDIGGFLGALAAGWGSDYWFHGKRIPLIILSSFTLIFAFMLIIFLSSESSIIYYILITIVGFLVFVPQMLVGLAAAELVVKEAASTSNGLVGCFAYLGAAVGGYPMIRIVELWGWHAFMITLAICSGVIVLVLLPIWAAKSVKMRGISITTTLTPSHSAS